MLESIGDKFTADDDTPFTVLVIVEPEKVTTFVLIIGTAAPVTPFTVVVKLFADEVLLTPLTALDVAATPFTVDVNVLVDNARVLVVVAVGVAPFTKIPEASKPK